MTTEDKQNDAIRALAGAIASVAAHQGNMSAVKAAHAAVECLTPDPAPEPEPRPAEAE